MKATQEKKADKNAPERDEESYGNYFNCQKKYLEIIYFQFLRNLKIDQFSKLSLVYFLDLSEYLSVKIFSVLDKKQNNYLTLEEFVNGMSLIFSKYFPENGKSLTNIIFNIISDNSESFNYERISEFFYNLIFEISIKSKIFNLEFFLNLTKNLRDYISKIMGVNSSNVKIIKFSKRDFLKIIEKNPSFINLIILLLNLLSPINEKLIMKLSQNNIKISLNDDFEDEYEIDSENEEETSANSIPISFMEGQCKIKTHFFDRSYVDRTDDRIELMEKSENNETNPEKKDDERLNLNKSCPINNKIFNVNRFEPEGNKTNSSNNNNNNSKSNPNCSTDTSDLEANKLALSFQNQIGKIDLTGTTQADNKEMSNLNKDNNKLKISNILTKNTNNHSFNELNHTRRNNLSGIDKIEMNNSDLKIAQEKDNNMVDLIINKVKNLDDEENCNVNLNVKVKITNDLKGKSYKITDLACNINKNREYNLGTDKNYVIPLKNYKIIKGLEKEDNLFSDIMILYKEIKNNNNNGSNNIVNNDIYSNKKNFRILLSKNLLVENNKYICNLDEFRPIIIKIVEFDLLLIQQNLKTYENESVHFLSMKNIYMDSKISFEENEYFFKYRGADLKYYVLKLFHFKQEYNILFETFPEMENFLNIINRQISNLININLHNLRLIFKTINLIESKKKPICIHEINDLHANRIIKLQTFKKESMNDEHLIFFRKVSDLSKINKFLKANLFPVTNIFENVDFIIVEYVDNDFKINYDKKENNFTISLKKVEMSSFIKDEVIKFKKIIKSLNIKKIVSTVFELIDLQGLVGIKK